MQAHLQQLPDLLASQDYWNRATEALKQYEQAHPAVNNALYYLALELRTDRIWQMDDVQLLSHETEGSPAFEQIMARIENRAITIINATEALITAYMTAMDEAGFRVSIEYGHIVAVIHPGRNRTKRNRAKARTKNAKNQAKQQRKGR